MKKKICARFSNRSPMGVEKLLAAIQKDDDLKDCMLEESDIEWVMLNCDCIIVDFMVLIYRMKCETLGQVRQCVQQEIYNRLDVLLQKEREKPVVLILVFDQDQYTVSLKRETQIKRTKKRTVWKANDMSGSFVEEDDVFKVEDLMANRGRRHEFFELVVEFVLECNLAEYPEATVILDGLHFGKDHKNNEQAHQLYFDIDSGETVTVSLQADEHCFGEGDLATFHWVRRMQKWLGGAEELVFLVETVDQDAIPISMLHYHEIMSNQAEDGGSKVILDLPVHRLLERPSGHRLKQLLKLSNEWIDL